MSSARRWLRLAKGATGYALARARGESFPFSATFILTHRCNFRCRYCDIPAAADHEMSADEFRAAIDELADVGLVRASFSGGEALLRADALEIMAHARARGLMVSMNTNAFLAVERLDALAEVLDLLVVSLDGPEPVHDLVRRRKGSYARVIELLAGARARGLPTATITVLNQLNLHVVDEVLELARQHEFHAYFQPAYRSCFDHRQGLDTALSPEVLRDLSSRLLAARRRGARVGASPGYLERLARAPSFGDCSTCTAGRFWCTVLPDGNLVPCHLTSSDTPPPNGRELGFAEAFRRLPRDKHGPGCAISPYQESDLIFSLDRAAMTSALRRLRR